MSFDRVTDPEIVVLKGVAKSFGETRALKNVDFTAYAGEVHAVVGENGSGKSTLAKIMSGILSPDNGSVKILGATPTNPIEARDLGLTTIFQEVLVAEEASILDNLYVGHDRLFISKSNKAERKAEAAELMERLVSRPVDLDAIVGSLPLSVKQWVVIARAILRNPKVLILDESSAALDLDATTRLHTEIKKLREKGSAILIVTHRIAELVRIADRATILRDGVSVAVLEKHEITEANLLAMMTPTDRKLVESDAVSALKCGAFGAEVVSVRSMKISPNSQEFDFSALEGQIVGVTGLDGQGQDEFLQFLVGIDSATSGVPIILANGKEEHLNGLADADRLGVSYVSGDRKREGIFPQQSIFENLAMGIYRRHLGPFGVIKRRELSEIFDKEVARLSIKIGSRKNKITSLSGGNQQKVLIGRTFARNPKVIVLNDPARGVDLGTKRDLYVELRRFTIAGGTVIYMSSEIEEFHGFADRVDVFVNNTIFRSLTGPAITEDEMLAAMFGQARHAQVSFDEKEMAT